MHRRLVPVLALGSALLALAAEASAQCLAPSGYYAAIDTSSSAALRRTLHARIENHQRVSWGGTWAVLERADQDPNSSSRILHVYRNASYAKVGRGNSNYDREHTWPKSLGFAMSSGSNYPEVDCHGLFLSAITHNGARGNKMFRNLSAAAREWTTVGGGSGRYPGRSNWASGNGVSGGWETWVDRRGDVARALFYFDVRYDGSRHRLGATEPNLVLTDEVAKIIASQSQSNFRPPDMGRWQAGLRALSAALRMSGLEAEFAGPTAIGETQQMAGPSVGMATRRRVEGGRSNRSSPDHRMSGGLNLSLAYMGLLSVLLEWHRQDPPDAKECRRNQVVYQAQGNRNPFTDHPEWVLRLHAPDLRDARRAWINEFHYDNAGQDVGEMIEIAGPVGLSLAGWRLVAYNGNGGRAYATQTLKGTIGASSGCTGTLAFDFPNLQNGPNDAIALVDPGDRVGWSSWAMRAA